MKFLVDMALSPSLALWLCEHGYDAVHASELSLDRAPDIELLRVAAADDRVVVTADLDFPRLLAILNADRPGLILLRGGNFTEAEARDCVRRVLMVLAPELISRSISVVDRRRVRRRDLPL